VKRKRKISRTKFIMLRRILWNTTPLVASCGIPGTNHHVLLGGGSGAILCTIRAAFNKTQSRRLQRGKALRTKMSSSVTSTKTTSTLSRRRGGGGSAQSRGGESRGPTSRRRRKHQPSGPLSRGSDDAAPPHHIYPKAAFLYTEPECSDQDIAFANTAQIVGIMQQSYDAPSAEEARARILGHLDGTSHFDILAALHQPIEPAARRRLRAFRVKTIDKIEIPPVEVPTDRQRRGSPFLPTEILRRVMREEAGTSISSRTVSLSCVVRENHKRRVQEKSAMASLATQQQSGVVVTKPNGTITKSRKHPVDMSITAHDLDDAALVGDAALVVEERANHSADQLDAAISDQRDNTHIEEAENGVVQLPQESSANLRITDSVPQTTMLSHDPGQKKRTSLKQRKSGQEVVADEREPSDPARQDDKSVSVKGENHNHADIQNDVFVHDGADQDENVMDEEELASFTPWRDGNVIPLSTNYVTRCERLAAPFVPFSPHPFAKRIPMVQPDRAAPFPPLGGVAMYGSIIAVKVIHNSREALETAHEKHEAELAHHVSASGKHRRSRSKRPTIDVCASSGFAQPPQIVMDPKNAGVAPKVTIEFINDDDSMDFGRVLFDC
jgi:hypothetical protein